MNYDQAAHIFCLKNHVIEFCSLIEKKHKKIYGKLLRF